MPCCRNVATCSKKCEYFMRLYSQSCWFRMKRSETSLHDRIGALFFFILFWSFASIFSTVYTFPVEKMIVDKDRAPGSYHLSAYYMAKVLVEAPFDLLFPTDSLSLHTLLSISILTRSHSCYIYLPWLCVLSQGVVLVCLPV